MLELAGASFSFEGAARKAVSNVTMSVSPGEHVALVGANGSGKSTLARLACGLIAPQEGRVLVDGRDASDRSMRGMVGLVQQDPRDQIVSSLVSDEVAFGPRNLGLDSLEVSRRVDEALAASGLEGFRDRATGGLSGGEQQRLAVAGILAMRPRYIVLDEAASMLDGSARRKLRRLVAELASERGMGVLSVTHDALDVLDADRVVVLDCGEVAWQGDARAFLALACADKGRLADVMRMDPYVRVALDVLGRGDGRAQCSAVPCDARALADPHGLARRWGALAPKDREEVRAGAVRLLSDSARHAAPEEDGPFARRSAESCVQRGLEARDVSFSYGDADALAGLSVDARPGRVVLLAGVSGSGKSTAARVLAGLYPPDKGEALLKGSPVHPGDVGLTFQRPEDQLFCETVGKDIAFGLVERGVPEAEAEGRALAAAEEFGMDRSMLGLSAYELSGGYARRAAIASIAVLEPGAYVFDEPTAGLDCEGRRFMRDVVRSRACAGASVVVVSHDVSEWLGTADDVVLVSEGRVAWAGAVGDALDAGVYSRAGMAAPELVDFIAAAGKEGL